MLLPFLFTLSFGINIWLDTNTGDAQLLSVIYGAHNFKILGISTVYGTHSAFEAANNVLKITTNLQLPDRIGVIQGHDLPMNNHSCIKSYDHGMYMPDAFSDHQIPILGRDLTKELNVQVEYRTENKNFTLLILGAASNFAKLFINYPERIHQVDEIVIVGGDFDGCDQNINCDPDALQIILEKALEYQIKLTFIPYLNVHIPPKFIQSLQQIDKRLSKWILGMINQENFSIYKLLGMYYLSNKKEFEIKKSDIAIKKSENCQGFTYFFESDDPKIQVAINVKVEKLFTSLFNVIIKAEKGALINI